MSAGNVTFEAHRFPELPAIRGSLSHMPQRLPTARVACGIPIVHRGRYLPGLDGSAFADATLRDLARCSEPMRCEGAWQGTQAVAR